MAADFGLLPVLVALGLLAASGDKSIVCATGPEDGNTTTVSVSSLPSTAEAGSSSGHKVSDGDPEVLDASEILRRDEVRVKWLQSKVNSARIDLVTNDPAMASSTSGKGITK